MTSKQTQPFLFVNYYFQGDVRTHRQTQAVLGVSVRFQNVKRGTRVSVSAQYTQRPGKVRAKPLRLILSDFYQTCYMYALLHCRHVRSWWLKRNLKIDCNKDKQQITEFVETVSFFSILWIISRSGNSHEIYS